MNRLYRLRVALLCACVLAAGCNGDGNEPATATPSASLGVTAADPSPPPSAGVATVTVSWVAPIENVDGSALTDLAGFVIAYGTASDALSKTVRIDNPSIDRYLLEDLPAGTWYFGVKAFSADGAESSLSTVMSKTID